MAIKIDFRNLIPKNIKNHATIDLNSKTQKILTRQIDIRTFNLDEAKKSAKLLQSQANRRIDVLRKHAAELRQLTRGGGSRAYRQLVKDLVKLGANANGRITLSRTTGENDAQYRNRLLAIIESTGDFLTAKTGSYTGTVTNYANSISGLAKHMGVSYEEAQSVINKVGFDKFFIQDV